MKNHRITEHAELEETHENHQVQPLALHTTPQESDQVPESIAQMLLGLCQVWGCDHFLGNPVPVPNHPLGEKLFTDIQP